MTDSVEAPAAGTSDTVQDPSRNPTGENPGSSAPSGNPPGTQADHQPGTLSPYTLADLNLRSQPFTGDPADGDYFVDASIESQIAGIREELVAGDDLLLLSGPSGAGKTSMLRLFTGNSGNRIQCFSVRGTPRFETYKLFAGLLEAFKLTPPSIFEDAIKESIPCLQTLTDRNSIGVIVIDDAHLIQESELKRLFGAMHVLNSGEETLLKLLLSVEPDFEDSIPDLLPSGVVIHYAALTVEPLTDARATDYLEFRLNQAGYFAELPFTPHQVDVMVKEAEGRPGALNILASEVLNNSEVYDTLPEAGASTSLLQAKPVRRFLGLLALISLGAAAFLFIPKPQVPTESYTVVATQPLNLNENEASASSADSDSAASLVVENPVVTETTPLQATAAPTAESEQASLPTTQSETASAPEPVPEPDSAPLPESGAEAGAETPSGSGAESMADTGTVPAADSVNTASRESETDPIALVTETDTNNNSAPSAPTETTSVVPESPVGPTPAPSSASANTETNPADSTVSTVDGTSTSADPTADGSEESANWVLLQDPQLYTIQMSASTDRKSVENFMKRADLDGPNSIFSFKRGDSTWFAFVHGMYPNLREARTAIEGMSDYARTNQPWIRSFKQIQEAVRKDQ